jgi:hypothetical protein
MAGPPVTELLDAAIDQHPEVRLHFRLELQKMAITDAPAIMSDGDVGAPCRFGCAETIETGFVRGFACAPAALARLAVVLPADGGLLAMIPTP